jgi:hypothetical protein
MLPVTLHTGARLLGTINYDEFEYNGVKVLGDVQPSRFFLGGRPAAYVIAFTFSSPAKL